MADRYFVMGQIYIEDVDSGIDVTGRVVADTNFTCSGAGSFEVYMANGTTGTVSGTNVNGTPVTLSAGLNTITATGAVVDGNFDITIGATANTNSVNSWSAASGGACGASIPTNADNAYQDANSFTMAGQTFNVDAALNCLAMDWTGATNTPTLAFGTNPINMFGNATLISGMTVTHTSGNGIYFNTSGTLTADGLFLNCNVGGASGVKTVQLGSNINLGTKEVDIRSTNTLVTNNYNITCGIFLASAYFNRTLTLGTSIIDCTSVGGNSETVTANTATINVTGTGAVALGSANWNGASFNLNGTAHTVSGNPTGIDTFTRTGTAAQTDTVTFTSGTTLTCTDFELIGNSRVNQLLAQSSTLGTAATITATNITITNCDLMDLTFTNAEDLSAQDDVGDCDGNTGITFPASATQTSTAALTWSNPAMWTSRIPLPQDDVSCSHNVTVDMPRVGRSITFTGTSAATLGMSISNYGGWTDVTAPTMGGFTHYLRGRGTGYTLSTMHSLTHMNSASYTTYHVDASSAAKTIVATGTTQIVSTFTRDFGTEIVSITGGTWTKVGSPVFIDYATVTNSTATPASTWFVGVNGTDGTGNTDWTFDAPNPIQAGLCDMRTPLPIPSLF